jgi:hypothetical protein
MSPERSLEQPRLLLQSHGKSDCKRRRASRLHSQASGLGTGHSSISISKFEYMRLTKRTVTWPSYMCLAHAGTCRRCSHLTRPRPHAPAPSLLGMPSPSCRCRADRPTSASRQMPFLRCAALPKVPRVCRRVLYPASGNLPPPQPPGLCRRGVYPRSGTLPVPKSPVASPRFCRPGLAGRPLRPAALRCPPGSGTCSCCRHSAHHRWPNVRSVLQENALHHAKDRSTPSHPEDVMALSTLSCKCKGMQC